ncbi:hypothetical protein CSAL01_09418 [Colletotrichum salicis]|uniref:BTB domain-containing protein n=1 Tax=Colletotrichum salicis TaxID=1209931 RepID=A0A135U5H7_9PEZI|nr:hypothetical protein CSAL01_09418 [Colletotrichum salicis]
MLLAKCIRESVQTPVKATREIQSRNIKFIVGPEKTEYTVYESRFTNLSPALRALLTGGFQESKEGKVIWDDTDPVTFVLLVQYAYNGHYSLPAPTKRMRLLKMATPPATCPVQWRYVSTFNAAEHRGSQHDFVNEKFFAGKTSNPETRRILKVATGVEKYEKACRHADHLMPMYVQHVRLYFLADKYTIEDLKQHCLDKIKHFLAECPGTFQLKTVLFESIPIIYSWTVHGDSLRRLITHYFIANMNWIDTGARFKALRRSTPEFGLDLLDAIPRSYWAELSDGPDKRENDEWEDWAQKQATRRVKTARR